MTEDLAELRDWLTGELRLPEPLTIRQFAGGRSNVTCRVDDASGGAVVVRRPPDGAHSGGAHDVLREARILTALADAAPPTPRVLAAVDAGAGTSWPFYVMEHVPGLVVDSVEVLSPFSAESRRALAFELVDVLVGLQAVDVDAVGLGDLRRTAPYVQRQLRRWTSQWERVADHDNPLVERVAERLERALPSLAPTPEVLVHGDYRLGNVIVTPGDRPRIAAVLDWELATVGHRLNDLAYLGARQLAPAEVLPGGRDPLSADGMPAFDELVSRYAAGGADVAELPYFVALNAWRWAIIAQDIAARLAAGAMGGDSADVAWQQSRVDTLARFAEEWLDRFSA